MKKTWLIIFDNYLLPKLQIQLILVNLGKSLCILSFLQELILNIA